MYVQKYRKPIILKDVVKKKRFNTIETDHAFLEYTVSVITTLTVNLSKASTSSRVQLFLFILMGLNP